MKTSNGSRPANWAPSEDSAVVADYLAMLALQSKGLPFNKSKTRRELVAGACAGRSEGSIEFKRCNVSAVLKDLGRPWLNGYRPESGANYQSALRRHIEAVLGVAPVSDVSSGSAGSNASQPSASAAAAA